MYDFSVYHILVTVACIALAVWLRIRLFGNLYIDDAARPVPACVPLPADDPEVELQGHTTADATLQQPAMAAHSA